MHVFGPEGSSDRGLAPRRAHRPTLFTSMCQQTNASTEPEIGISFDRSYQLKKIYKSVLLLAWLRCLNIITSVLCFHIDSLLSLKP